MQSYPFLSIAKRFGYDYGETLLVADALRTGELRLINETMWQKWQQRSIAIIAIGSALSDFRAIQAGLVDYETGEPVNRQSIGRGFRDVPKPGVIVDHSLSLDRRDKRPGLRLYEGTNDPDPMMQVCPICDGGPGNYNTCSCQKE